MVVKMGCGAQQLADCLTKANGDLNYFSWVMQNARFILIRDQKLEQRMTHGVVQKMDTLQKPPLNETPEERSRRRSQQKQANHHRRLRDLKASMASPENYFSNALDRSLSIGLGALLPSCVSTGLDS